MSKQKSIAVNSIFNFILKAFRIAVPIIVGPYLARVLSKDGYAIYNEVSTYVTVFLIFAEFGIYNYALRETSKVRDDVTRVQRTFTNILTINTFSTIITLFAYMLFILLGTGQEAFPVYLAFAIKIFANLFLVEWVNEAVENYRFITIKTIIVRTLYLVLIFVMVREADDVLNYALVVSLIEVLNNIISFIYVKTRLRLNFTGFNPRPHIKPLMQITLISNVNILFMQLDKMMLTKVADKVAITYYTIPQNIASIITTLLMSVTSVGVSRLSYYLGNNRTRDYEETLQKIHRIAMFLVIPASVGMFCLAKEILYLYSGSDYFGATPTLMVFCLRVMVSAHYSLQAQLVLYIKKKEKWIITALLTGGVINIIANSLLILFGKMLPVTAIATTTAAEIVVNILLSRYSKKLGTGLRFFKKTTVTYLVLSLTFIPITIIFNILFEANLIMHILCIVPSCALIYFLVLWIAKDESLLYFLNRFVLKFIRRLKKS